MLEVIKHNASYIPYKITHKEYNNYQQPYRTKWDSHVHIPNKLWGDCCCDHIVLVSSKKIQ
jgi:hypothetical protein